LHIAEGWAVPRSRSIFHARWAICFALLLAAFDATQAAAAEQVLNKMCQVMTEEEADPEISVEYLGKKVLLCCPKCKRLFSENPAKFIDKLPQFQTPTTAATTTASTTLSQAPEKAPDPKPAASEGRLTRFLGKLHPAVVHFPIALLLCAAFVEVLSLLTRQPRFADASRVMVWLGVGGALAASLLGLAAGAHAEHTGELALVLDRHRWLGISTTVLAVLTLILRESAARRPDGGKWLWGYRIVLFASAALVGLTGHLGGALVYGLDHYRW